MRGVSVWLFHLVACSRMVRYLSFVVVFQLLTLSLRMKEEFYLDKAFSDALLMNHFDGDHNTFGTVRRVADIYQWGNNVLWPGLLGNAGPWCGSVGTGGTFQSSIVPLLPSNLTHFKGGCNDDTWPDGDGPFHHIEATAPTVADVVDRFNQCANADAMCICHHVCMHACACAPSSCVWLAHGVTAM